MIRIGQTLVNDPPLAFREALRKEMFRCPISFVSFPADPWRRKAGKHGLMRLQFNKIGYEMYDKEQSRRVPAVRAKPGNPGYGFRRARQVSAA
jgi:hypothetical protein